MTLHHFDIATVCLNGKLKEKVFMEIPKHTTDALSNIVSSEGISVDIRKKAKGMLERIKKGDKVCLLNKSLYGLRQAGRYRNARINEELLNYEEIIRSVSISQGRRSRPDLDSRLRRRPHRSLAE